MKAIKVMSRIAAAVVLVASSSASHAQGIPVYDNAQFLQQVQQVVSWGKQLTEMKAQLTQMKQTYDSLNGLRDVGGLLNNELLTQYIPKDYVTAVNDLRSGVKGAFSGISGDLQDIVKANQLWQCSKQTAKKAEQEACEKQWQQLALDKKLGDIGYQQAAKNIDNLQQFINSIKTSPDQKSLSDLQARIQVEQVRMANEEIKLRTVAMMREADERLRQQASIDAFKSSMSNGVRSVKF